MIEFIKKKYFLVILVLFILLSGVLINLDLPVFGKDSSFYLILSRSISSGQGYSDLYYPQNPPNTEFPFVYPLILAMILKIFPKAVIELKLLSVLFGLASLIGIYLLFLNKHNNDVQNKRFTAVIYDLARLNHEWVILLLVCTNLWFLLFSTLIASEIIYLFFSLITLIWLEKYADNVKVVNKYLFLVSFMLIASFFIKFIGFSLFMAGSIYFFMIRNKYKKGLLLVVFYFLLILPWIIRLILVSDSAVSMNYLDQFILGHRLSVMNIARAIPGNIIRYTYKIPAFLFSGYFSPLVLKGKKVYFIFSALGSIFIFINVLWGFILNFRKGKNNLINIYTLCYLGIIIVLPGCLYAKIGNRLFFPLLPFIIYYFLNGLVVMIFWFSRFVNLSFFKNKYWVLVGGLCFIFIGNLFVILRSAKSNGLYCSGCTSLSKIQREKYILSWYIGQLTVIEWVRENTLLNDAFMCSNPALFYLETNRRAVYFQKEPYYPNYRRETEEIEFIIKDKKIKYIIADNDEQKEIIDQINYQENIKLILVPLKKFKLLEEGWIEIYKVVEINLQAKALNSQGVYSFSNKDFKQAIANFKKVLEIDPNFLLYFNLGSCYEKKGLFEESAGFYNKAIDLQPNYEIAKNRVSFLRQKRVVEKKPKDAGEYLLLGDIYLKNHDFFQAVLSFKRALQLDSRLTIAYYNLGIVYSYVQDYDLAILYLKKVIGMNSLLKNKAECLIKINEKIKNIQEQDSN
ncbi:tetratricopeptide repeat protein [bacterium]|nr:tetratricopeptide repeat protein [bacterium]